MAKIKGGGTKKVCLPAAKVRSMSQAERDKVVRAKRSAASQGKYKRSSKSFVKGARKKGATLRDWFEKENWINVATGEPCGGGSKKRNRSKGASMKKAPYGPSAAEPRRTIGRGKNFNKANPTGTLSLIHISSPRD